MSDIGKKNKKKRNKPCKPPGVHSKGSAKARKHPLSELEKVLVGKGAMDRVRPVSCHAWRGVGETR